MKTDRTALATGAASSAGLAIARRLAWAGHAVVMADRLEPMVSR